MKQRFFLFLIALALAMAQGWAVIGDLDPQNVNMVAAVGQNASQTITLFFLNETEGLSDSFDYSVSIDGQDHAMFDAQITEKSLGSGIKSCTVLITYSPTTEGPHQATLKVSLGNSLKTVTLNGETSQNDQDPFSVHSNGLHELDQMDSSDSSNFMSPDRWIILDRDDDGLSSPDAVIQLSSLSLDFGNTMVGSSAQKTFFVKGENLTGPLTLSVVSSQSGANDGFSIDKTSISAYQAKSGMTVTVTYEPSCAGTQNTTSVLISGGGAESKTIALSGTAVQAMLPITIAPAKLSFSGVPVGHSVTKEFIVIAPISNATEFVTLQPVLDDPSGMFSITPQSFTAREAANGARVKVTYQPTEYGAHSASVVINGSGVENRTVNLNGKTYDEFSTILVTADDITTEYLIDENSNIKIERTHLVINSQNQVSTIDLDNLAQMSYGHRIVPAEAEQETLKAGTIIMHGLKESDLINVTDGDGRVVMKKTGGNDGNVVLSLDDEPSGEYLISTDSQTIKIVKQ